MDTYPDLSRSESIALEKGHARVITNPESGLSQIVNIASGEARDIRDRTVGSAASVKSTPATPEKTLFEQTGQVTGIVPTLLNKIQGFVGQAGLRVIDPEVQQGIQDFNTSQKELFNALKDSGRYVQGEIDMLSQELNIKPGAWTDEQSLRAKMTSVHGSLRRRLANEMSASENINLPLQDRQDAKSAENALSNFLAAMGNPEDAPKEDSEASAKNTPPEGIEPEAAAVWAGMDEAGRALFQPKAK